MLAACFSSPISPSFHQDIPVISLINRPFPVLYLQYIYASNRVSKISVRLVLRALKRLDN